MTALERLFDYLAGRDYTPTFTFRLDSDAVTLQADTSFRTMLAPINVASDDKRVIVDALGWREPPLPFMASDSEMGHGDAVRVGNLTDFSQETVDGTEFLTATVTFDSDAERGDEFAALAAEGSFNGVSIHMGKVRFADVVQDADGTWREVTFEEIVEFIEEHEDDPDAIEGFIDALHLGAFDAEVAAATQVAIPAFPEAGIDADTAQEVADDAEPVEASVGDVLRSLFEAAPGARVTLPDGTYTFETIDFSDNGSVTVEPVMAATSLDRPPASWFANPELDEPTPLTVTDDGRVYGHLATWDTCHAGFKDRCVQAPKATDYSTFLTARVITDDGERQPVGPLVVDDGHAPAEWGMERVVNYYADTKLAAAYVNVGEDDHGVWVAGAVSHKATEAQVETLRRHPLSGDWRPYNGKYRLIAAVSVNNPGLPIPEVLVASGEPVGLITYGPADPYASDLALVASAIEHFGGQLAAVQDLVTAILDEQERPTVDAEADALLKDL